jgi:hypothetical protein
MDNSNTFWANNPKILLEQNQLQYFFPSSNYSMVTNLNVVVRLFIYLAIILVLYTKNPQYFLLPVGAMVVTYILFTYYPNQTELFYVQPENQCILTMNDKRELQKRRKNYISKKCTKPTSENPFMNYNHITDNYHKPHACEAFIYGDTQSMEVRKDVTDKFNEKLYRDVGDLYSRRNSQREFYTIGYNGIPNQTEVAKWRYGLSNSTCKESGLNCAGWTGSLI